MSDFQLAQNLINLRRRRGITQEELAKFLGVTKASVSKWETRNSMPDIALLPKLAAYYDISIDELIGYQAQLTSEEISKMYHRFAKAFSQKPFHEVMEESREFVKQYYSCYPALLQIALLWTNHYMIPKEEQEQRKILEEIMALCSHIETHCTDVGVCSDSMVLRSIAMLGLGKAEEVIQNMEPLNDPKRMAGQADSILVQAYQIAGKEQKAQEFNQFVIYKHLLGMVEGSVVYLMYHLMDTGLGEMTISRIEKVIEAYKLAELHPNACLQFLYVKAQFYSIHGEIKQATEALEGFVKGSINFVKSGICIHGDQYFNLIENFFQESHIDRVPPREKKTILDSVVETLEHPAFAGIQDTKKYKELKRLLETEGREMK